MLKSKKLTLFLILFFLSYYVITVTSAFSLGEHKSLVATGSGTLDKMKELATTSKPKELFQKVGGVLKKLGPLKMSISALISNFTMVSKPKAESPELKAINEGFEKLNQRLDSLASKIGNLDNIVELSNSKAAYVQIVTTINHLYESLEDAKTESTKDGYKLFGKQYEKSYKFAASNMYDALSGSTGPFGFNMINLYKNYVKCNPTLISEFCLMGVHLINKGLAIEGAYLGYIDFDAKIETKMEAWQVKLDGITKQCESILDVCENSWKETAYKQFRDTHETIGGDNQAFAEKLAKDLNNVVPQRSWLAVVYNDAGGFGPHTYSSYYEAQTIWNEKDHDMTIFSTPREDKLTGDNYNNLLNLINGQKAKIASVNNCERTVFWLTKEATYKDNDARTIVNMIREKYMTGVVYAVKMNHNPGQAATGNTLYASDQKWQCTSEQFRLIIFQ